MIYIPRFLSRPIPLLFVEADELGILLFVGFIGFDIHIALGVVLLPLTYFVYKNLKRKNGKGFIRHIPHMLGFKTFKGFPHAFVKEFYE